MSDTTWRFRGGIWLRDLQVPKHWAQVNPDGSWTISTGRGKKAVVQHRGYEQNPEVAKRVIKEWEDRH